MTESILRVALSTWGKRIIALLLGALFPVGFAPLKIWPFMLLSVAGLFWLTRQQSRWQAFKMAYFYGLGFFAVGASWVHVSIHTFGHAPLPLSIFLTLLFVFGLALYKGLFGYFIGIAYEYGGHKGYLMAFPLAWLAVDWFQGVFLTGFPWLYLGYGLVETWFGGWIRIVGVLGVGYLIVALVAVSVYFVGEFEIAQSRIRNAIHLAVIWIIVVLGAFIADDHGHLGEKSSQTLTVALVQPNIEQSEKWNPSLLLEYLKRYDQMTEPYWGADIIVWPEAAIPAFKHRVDNWLDQWEERANDSGSELILGIPIADLNNRQVFASMINLGGKSQRYDKQHLVPFGEYVPLENLLRGLIEFFNLPMSSFSSGDANQPPIQLQNLDVLPAICYEIAYSSTFSNMLKMQKKQRDTIIVTISNDAWFGQSWGPHQHLQIAQARALEFGTPVIRSTNNGITAMINSNGIVVEKIPQFSRQVLNNKFELEFSKTLFGNHPYITILLLLAIVQLYTCFSRLTR